MAWPDPFDDTPESEREREDKREPSPVQRIRSSSAYQTLIAQFRVYCQGYRNADGTTGLPCSLCSRPIDYRLPHWSKMAFQAHHDLSVADRPDLIMSWANLRATHARCNQKHGRGTPEDTDDMIKLLGTPSEAWRLLPDAKSGTDTHRCAWQGRLLVVVASPQNICRRRHGSRLVAKFSP